MLVLPENLKFTFPYADAQLDLSKWTGLEVSSVGNGLLLETEAGKRIVKTSQKVWEVITSYTCVFMYCPPGMEDLLLILMTDKELMALNLFGKVETNGYLVNKLKSFMRIDKTPIINLFPMTKLDYGAGLEGCTKAATEVIASRDFGIYNMSTGASEARALITQFDSFMDEIRMARRLGRDVLDKGLQACHGGRMESAGIGSQFQVHYDLIKAHLRFLEEYPGVRDLSVSKGSRTGIDRSLGISMYKIKADIPKGLKFNPLPQWTEAGIKYRSGEIIEWYYKPYLELLDWLKANGVPVEYKVLDSIQFFGKPTHPLKDWASVIRGTIKLFESQWEGLEYKHLYCTIAGSTKSLYSSRGKDLEVVNKASRIIDPMIYGYVLSRQNCEVYQKAIEEEAEAIKIDSIATRKYTGEIKGFKVKGIGMSTYLTPYLKTTPNGNKVYRSKIIDGMSRSAVTIRMPVWVGLKQYLGETLDSTGIGKLGEKTFVTRVIKPHYGGNREGKEVKKVGELLTGWLESKSGNESKGAGEVQEWNEARVAGYLDRVKNR